MDTPNLNPLLAHVVPYTLVLFRLAGVFLMAPLLTNVMIPRVYKALLVFVLTAAMYPMVSTTIASPSVTTGLDLFGLIPLVVMESLIGLAMGAIASIPLLSLEMAGVMIGQNMGLGLAKVYNPEADFEADVIGQFLYYIGATIFVAIGGLEKLFGGVVESFARVPLGGFGIERTPLDLLVGVLSTGFELAIRVSAPVTGIIMLLVVVLGVVGKTMPALNVMSVGFAMKIIAGLAMLAASIYAVSHAVGGEVVAALDTAVRWVGSL